MRTTRLLWIKLASSAAASVLCYALLFVYEQEIMRAFTRTDGWYPVLPVAAAFLFSLAHGAFAGYFWDALGIQARTSRPAADASEVEE
jgi:hypothetical protein